ncbi:hypothetical protein [Streptomyces sp. NBC_00829]|uniref:hypothetical protein n=1 Tax=Streptomyces sp. NBC_00829 TaxID=2903679 RepID=UPI003863F4C8|nr:hypothetical protein OG293_23115 [Streptomyces sp. NBC_00829]
MIIVYTPPGGGEPEHFDAKTLLSSEASIVQRTIDMKWAQIRAGLADDDLEALRGVAWILKKRHEPNLRFADFDPGVDDLRSYFDKTEVVTYVEESIAVATNDPSVTGEHMAFALRNLPSAAIDPAHAEAVVKELTEAMGKDEDPAPEDAAAVEPDSESSSLISPTTSTTAEPSTSDSSHTSSTSLPEGSTP